MSLCSFLVYTTSLVGVASLEKDCILFIYFLLLLFLARKREIVILDAIILYVIFSILIIYELIYEDVI